MKKGVKPVAQHGVVSRLHSTDGSSATHLAWNFSSHLKNSWLQALQDHAVRPLDLPICLRVGNGRLVHKNVVVVAKVEKFLPCELGTIISDDRVGYAEAVDNVGEERHCPLRADVDDGSSLNPLGEFVDRYEEVSEAPSACQSGPTMSRCQTAKCHVMEMVCSACAGS
jgi:hypothetical protein